MIDDFEALKVISEHRDGAVVVATMTANFIWPQVSTNPGLDLMFSGAMGKASSVGLGLALARPDKQVVVLDGEGSLLMNLGTLVTIAEMSPRNLVHIVLDNDVYRTSGGQPVPNAGKTSYTGFAEAVGYANVYSFDDLDGLKSDIERVLKQAGPTFIALKTVPAKERPPYPMTFTAGIIERFKTALQNT